MIELFYNPARDAVWGWTKDLLGTCITFHGRRKGPLTFIHDLSRNDIGAIKGRLEGYNIVGKHKRYYLPKDFKQQLMLAQLGQTRMEKRIDLCQKMVDLPTHLVHNKNMSTKLVC